jgi:hypothetical protein
VLSAAAQMNEPAGFIAFAGRAAAERFAAAHGGGIDVFLHLKAARPDQATPARWAGGRRNVSSRFTANKVMAVISMPAETGRSAHMTGTYDS